MKILKEDTLLNKKPPAFCRGFTMKQYAPIVSTDWNIGTAFNLGKTEMKRFNSSSEFHLPHLTRMSEKVQVVFDLINRDRTSQNPKSETNMREVSRIMECST